MLIYGMLLNVIYIEQTDSNISEYYSLNLYFINQNDLFNAKHVLFKTGELRNLFINPRLLILEYNDNINPISFKEETEVFKKLPQFHNIVKRKREKENQK
jgi:hypothetical protein